MNVFFSDFVHRKNAVIGYFCGANKSENRHIFETVLKKVKNTLWSDAEICCFALMDLEAVIFSLANIISGLCNKHMFR